MEVQIRMFAGLAEITKSNVVSLDVPNDADVAYLRQCLMEKYPDARSELNRALAAVNRQYAAPNQGVTETDEIAMIPPVGGGSPEGGARLGHQINWPTCYITEEPLLAEVAQAKLEDIHLGGTVLFLGTVRGRTGNRETAYLEYEAYTEMAIAQMQAIEHGIREKYAGVSTIQWHRVGRLLPGEIAVICAAAAPHRPDAFAAARELIDTLKREVPIWKREVYADGEQVWQENPEASSTGESGSDGEADSDGESSSIGE